MKKIIFALIALFFCFNSYSQSVISGVKDGVSYITPCVENFAYLSTVSQSTFARIMDEYHYSESGGSAQWYSYTASLDNFMVHAATNYDYAYGGGAIICWIPKAEMYPYTAIQDIYRKLRPHYVRRDQDGELFAFNYNGKAFGCIIINSDKFYVIRTNYFGAADSRLQIL